MQQLTLNIIIHLSQSPRTTLELCDFFRISSTSLKRHLATARRLGAIIKTKKFNGHNSYVLENWSDISHCVTSWSKVNSTFDFRVCDLRSVVIK